MSENEKIWVLGGKASNADKNIAWQRDIPNLSNSDKLIIDLNTLPSGVPIPKSELGNYLRYMIMAGKSIYVILAPEPINHLSDVLPVFPEQVVIKPCDFDKINLLDARDIPNEIVEYCKYVENCTFFINQIDPSFLLNCLHPKAWNRENYYFSDEIDHLLQENILEVLNVSCQTIGCACKYSILNSGNTVLEQTGPIFFLPPPTKINSSEAVQVLVNSLIDISLKEQEPEWVSKLQMPKTDQLKKQISKENEKVEEITKRIQNLKREKAELEKHKKLLWTFDKPLEQAVKDAFSLLGFHEIREGRSRELEDLVIDFKTSNHYVHGVLEVKGREKKTSLNDMNQCSKWVNQYWVQEEKRVKGIFVTNQFRRKETLSSKKRIKFEPNEIQFAQEFKICVLPTRELFKAVIHILNGGKLSRNEFEEKILNANPICTLVD